MSVTYQDYYKTLNIKRTATPNEIQKAYRKLARKYHPDVNKAPDAEAKFKAVSEAYKVLKDPEKRKRYDTLGANWEANQEYQAPPGWENAEFQFDGAEEGGGFSDFFKSLFGSLGGKGQGASFRDLGGMEQGASFQDLGDMGRGSAFGGRAPRKQRGRDQEVEIEITLEEAAQGVKRTLQLEQISPSHEGAMHTEQTRYDVTIPKGVIDGARIRLARQGEKGFHGGKAGDLYLRVRLKPHPRFQTSGRDLKTSVSVAPWEAALGAEIDVPTLEGKISMKIPAGTDSHQILRLRGKGLPGRGKPDGDLLVSIRIKVPKKLSARERTLFEELSGASTFKPRG